MERVDDLALIMTLEMGKPLAESKAEVTYAADFFHWFAGEATRIEGGYKPAEKGGFRVADDAPAGRPVHLHHARGTSRWRWARASSARRSPPAARRSSSRPSRRRCRCSRSRRSSRRPGLPGGVVNVITAKSSGKVDGAADQGPAGPQALLHRLDRGRQDAHRAVAPTRCSSVSMELGGNAPFLVFDDADIDAAVEGAMIAKMRNIGEACTAANRFHVARVGRRRVRREARREDGRAEGRPRHRGGRRRSARSSTTTSAPRSPSSSRTRRARARRSSPAARSSTARGYFYKPTVLTDVADDARLLKEEIFGPVAPISGVLRPRTRRSPPRTTPSTASSPTSTREDLKRAFRVCEALETGMVGLNQGLVSNAGAPFGGVKHSGLRPRGRQGGHRRVPRDEVRRDGDVASGAGAAARVAVFPGRVAGGDLHRRGVPRPADAAP